MVCAACGWPPSASRPPRCSKRHAPSVGHPRTCCVRLIDAGIAGRDQANRRIRLKQAGFPATKTLESFDVAASGIPRPTFEYLASLEWVRATENLLLVGPAGTGKSHSLIGVGHRAIERGLRVRYFVAADLVEALYPRLGRQHRRQTGSRHPAQRSGSHR
jgi:DNA replication protein DnaC